jgi:hypothetical protein
LAKLLSFMRNSLGALADQRIKPGRIKLAKGEVNPDALAA